MENKEISQASWDCANQELCDLKREVARLTLLEQFYLTEIEALQTKHSKQLKEQETKINSLEEDKRAVEQLKTKKIEEIEQTLLLKHEEIKTLTEKLEAASKMALEIHKSAKLQMLNSKVGELEKENVSLKEENNELKKCVDDLKKHVNNYEDEIDNLKEEYSSLTANYQCKCEDLKGAKEMIEILEDEIMSVKTELEIVKSKSTEGNSQGKSFFVEVDEKRLQLQTKVKKMRTHYEQMKHQIIRLQNQISTMHTENGTLRQNWEKGIKQRTNDKYDTKEVYNERVLSLESFIKNYKKELEIHVR